MKSDKITDNGATRIRGGPQKNMDRGNRKGYDSPYFNQGDGPPNRAEWKKGII